MSYFGGWDLQGVSIVKKKKNTVLQTTENRGPYFLIEIYL